MSPENAVDVLVVEDDARDLELLLRALGKANVGHRLEVARDGAEALEFLFSEGAHSGREGEHRPKVVLLDLKLPKVDGLEVLRTIKEDPEMKCIPVVMLTSSREERDLVRSYSLGVNAYVVKPVDFHEFVNALKEVGLFWAVINQAPPGEEPGSA